MTDELSDFTKLVLARLETNPDEFQMGGRWDTLVRGLEAVAADDTESRYLRTLWPLTDHERSVMLEAYRKAYLARLHKDMLKNIVSGDDLPQNKAMDPRTYTIGTNIIGNSGSAITTSAMKQATLTTLEASFDKVYNDTFANAVVKGEGQAVAMDANTMTYKPQNRYVLNRSQAEIAKKLGISPYEYAKLLKAHE